MCRLKDEAHVGNRVDIRIALRAYLFRVLPKSVADWLLRAWRAFYWWNKKRIRPGKNRRLVRKIVAGRAPIKLELGSWRRPGMEDWITSDINGGGDLHLDLTRPMPFPDDSVERIYSSHLIEHFLYPTPMLDLLRECKRILKLNGLLSVAVPNARPYLNAYIDDSDFDKEKFCNHEVGLTFEARIDYVNFVAHLGGEHKHLFDENNLLLILKEAGFSDVRLRNFDPSLDRDDRRHDSIYAEGRK
jgi:predicted SAM-dependent methyltransferase